jgi:hypothetical protein
VPEGVPDRDRLWRDTGERGDWMLDGYSAIVDPAGTVVAGPLVREEGILYADLDLDDGRARRRLFDPAGHYNRPDVFRLVVDDRPKPHVVSLAAGSAVGSVAGDRRERAGDVGRLGGRGRGAVAGGPGPGPAGAPPGLR